MNTKNDKSNGKETRGSNKRKKTRGKDKEVIKVVEEIKKVGV